MTNKPGIGGPPAAGAPHKVGDANAGFEASADKRNRILRVRLWGVWDIAMAEQFVASVVALGGELSGAPWASLVDARKFMVQSPQILQIRQESLNRAAALGCTKMATLVESAAYSLQFKRLAGTSHIQSETFHDEISAMMWLRKA